MKQNKIRIPDSCIPTTSHSGEGGVWYLYFQRRPTEMWQVSRAMCNHKKA